MDPNANLQEQSGLVDSPNPTTEDRNRLRELRISLLNWMHRGGFEPVWTDYDKATVLFNRWRARYYGI